jgi:hypothetical protein
MENEKGMEEEKALLTPKRYPKEVEAIKKEKKIYGGWVIGLYCHPCNLQYNVAVERHEIRSDVLALSISAERRDL